MSSAGSRKGKAKRSRSAGGERRSPDAKKVVTDFPAPLFQRTEQAAQELSMNRSRLIRLAVEAFLRQRDRDNLERALAESFAANTKMDDDLMEGFQDVDTDHSPL
jgi:metal-responsive CopG/Arc/MetJ family transcriptional regulator